MTGKSACQLDIVPIKYVPNEMNQMGRSAVLSRDTWSGKSLKNYNLIARDQLLRHYKVNFNPTCHPKIMTRML